MTLVFRHTKAISILEDSKVTTNDTHTDKDDIIDKLYTCRHIYMYLPCVQRDGWIGKLL